MPERKRVYSAASAILGAAVLVGSVSQKDSARTMSSSNSPTLHVVRHIDQLPTHDFLVRAPAPALPPLPLFGPLRQTIVDEVLDSENGIEFLRLAQEEEKRKQYFQAQHITIPSLRIDTNIAEVKFDNEGKTWVLPNSGGLVSPALSTPEDPQPEYSNIIPVFGHSIWSSVPQAFYGLYQLQVDDKISVSVKSKYNQERIDFTVSGIVILDTTQADKALFQSQEPTLVLLTSIKPDGQEQWILPKDTVLANAQVFTTHLNSREHYLVLAIFAKQKQ